MRLLKNGHELEVSSKQLVKALVLLLLLGLLLLGLLQLFRNEEVDARRPLQEAQAGDCGIDPDTSCILQLCFEWIDGVRSLEDRRCQCQYHRWQRC